MQSNFIRLFSSSKGAAQLDFVIAVGLFLVLFAFIILSFSSFVAPIKNLADIAQLRSEAETLRGVADSEYVPRDWPPPFLGANTVFLLRLDNSTADSSSSGNSGTSAGGLNCAPNVQGIILSACAFDGTNDAVNVSDNAATSVTGNFTIEAWLRIEPASAKNMSVVSKYEPGGNQRSYALFVRNDSKVDFRISTDGSAVMNVVSNSTLSTNVWYHVAGVFVTNTSLNIYVNGVLENRNVSSVPSSVLDSSVATTIGGRGGAAESFFNGTIDEVRLTNRSLNTTEIQEHHEFGKKLRRLGLSTRAYKMTVLINNTAAFLRNTSDPVARITNELVTFNISSFIENYDLNSVAVYDDYNRSVTYQRSGQNFSFVVEVNASQERFYTVYFDDDSRRFLEPGNTVSGVDNLTETVFTPERMTLVQYDKLAQLNLTNMTHVKEGTRMEGSFRIKITDLDTNSSSIDVGETLPKTGNVVSLQRFVVFQNSTAGIRRGKMIVQVW
ncbi:MAG: LamG domain-containing protein [Candidatus Aenigmarchaeota archaeon]|nr:LamG domain-containing protein [Candidatus Aenigmarchaeota archaeon]